jgi:hypothetical protein
LPAQEEQQQKEEYKQEEEYRQKQQSIAAARLNNFDVDNVGGEPFHLEFLFRYSDIL